MKNQEFENFLTADPVSPPQALSESILKSVRNDLAISPGYLFAKLFLIHLVVGGLTLMFCPQFGIGPLGGSHGMAHWTMHWGPKVCAMICGAVFLGGSALVASLLLAKPELAALRRHLFAYYGMMVSLSGGGLLIASKIFSTTSHFPESAAFLGIWAGAAVISASLLTSLIAAARRLRVTNLSLPSP